MLHLGSLGLYIHCVESFAQEARGVEAPSPSRVVELNTAAITSSYVCQCVYVGVYVCV